MSVTMTDKRVEVWRFPATRQQKRNSKLKQQVPPIIAVFIHRYND